MGTYLRTGIGAVFVATCLLVACRSDAPATPDWLLTDGAWTSHLAVLDDGTQLATGTGDKAWLRAASGNLLSNLTLPYGSAQIVLAEQDHFLLFGESGNSIWRVSLDVNGAVQSNEILYSGSSLSLPLQLQQWGNRFVLHWLDDGKFTWYSPQSQQVLQYPVELGTSAHSMTADLHLWYIDSATTELVEVDASSLQELQREAVDGGFLNSVRLYVNDNFVVGAQASAVHEGVDLLVQHRLNGDTSTIGSLGGYGTFHQNLLGQDGQGNIYYYYFAALPHSGFAIGMHVRCISPTQLAAWEYRIASGVPDTNSVRARPLDTGVQLIYTGVTTDVDINQSLTRSYTSYYRQLNGLGVALESFYLQPHRVQLGIGLGGTYESLLQTGYLAQHFGTDSNSVVYIHGKTGAAVNTTSQYFAGAF